MRRHFLFLQGGVSPFFARLGSHLKDAGHHVSRVDFCAGDCLVWRSPGAVAFREPVSQLPALLESFCAAHEVTDLLLFGGCRPTHRPALALARDLSIRAHVFDEGYLRPNWMTLERGGVNGDSPLPRDPDWYRRVGPLLPEVAKTPVNGNELVARAIRGGAYQLARLADPLLFPHYRTHRRDPAMAETLGWMKRFGRLPFRHRRDCSIGASLIAGGEPFFLLPLQLHGDIQVTCYSGFADMQELIGRVISSFARWAPAESRLLIKNHPLDSGMVDYEYCTRRSAADAGVAHRVEYIETGDLYGLAAAAAGMVTINSTAGLAALLRACPTIALGQAVYDLPGLTFQGSLDRFWTARKRPDPVLVEVFWRTLAYASQVRGNPYTAAGIRSAVLDAERFLAPTSPLERLLECVPLADETAAAA